MPLQLVSQAVYQSNSSFGAPQLLSSYQIAGTSHVGVRVVDILESNPADVHLLSAQDLAFPGMSGTKISFRILWPGYAPYTHQFNSRSWVHAISTPLTIDQAAKTLASEIRHAVNALSRQQCGPHGLRLGPNGIGLDDIFLVAITRVSSGSVQPILAVGRSAFEAQETTTM